MTVYRSTMWAVLPKRAGKRRSWLTCWPTREEARECCASVERIAKVKLMEIPQRRKR